MPEGLLHRNRCVESIFCVYSTPLTVGSVVSLAYRSRSLWCKVVVERPREDGRGGLQNKLNAAELQLELLMHVAARPGGYAVAVSGYETCRAVRDVSREGAYPKPRTRQAITTVVFVSAICDVNVCAPCDA